MKHFTKIFGALATILVFYSLILGGFDLGQHHYQVAVPNLVVGFFWFVILAVLAFEAVSNARTKAELEFIEKTDEMLKGLAEVELERNEIIQSLDGIFIECVEKVTGGGRAPTLEEQQTISAIFHDQTGHYARFTGDQTDEGGNVEITSEPFETETPHSAQTAQEADMGVAGVRRVIPVTDGNETAPKSPTKAQQRRLNTKKGLGPLTDDEVREQKNAKRREARAAKKAATTSTTTQPGQTKLV